MEGEKGTVCVTGGTGFVASWLIMRLLELGYSVHATIRPDPDHQRDLNFLTSLPGASEKLSIFEADLGDPESFDEAVKGCVGVFHVATPVVDFENKEPEEVFTKRAVDGMLGILKACLEAQTVKRVVYTSSATAVFFNGEDVDLMDETYWTDVDYVRAKITSGASYFISKTLTEKTALEFAQEHKLDVVTIIPAGVVGPFICPKLPLSVRLSLAMLWGEKELVASLLNMSLVHVDDVARAHIFLFEHPEAKGRYNCSSHFMTNQELAKFLSAKYPEFPIPMAESLEDIKGVKTADVSSEKLLKSGFSYKYGLDEMFDGAVQCCKEKGKKELVASLLNMSMVHVDDLARAHIFLFEHPETKGRHNCSSHFTTNQELAKFLSAKYPKFPIPTMESLKDIKGFKAAEVSSEKLLKSGFSYKYRLDEMVDEAIRCCKENGYL